MKKSLINGLLKKPSKTVKEIIVKAYIPNKPKFYGKNKDRICKFTIVFNSSFDKYFLELESTRKPLFKKFEAIYKKNLPVKILVATMVNEYNNIIVNEDDFYFNIRKVTVNNEIDIINEIDF